MPKVFKYPIIFLFICILGFIIYSLYFRSEDYKTNEILKNTDENYAILDEYFIYGRNLNIKGHIFINSSVDKVNLVLKEFNKKEILYEMKYNIEDDNLYFNISDEINNGINLDDINKGNYYLLIKVSNNDDERYYSISNETRYINNEYYTITRNNKNNKILIDFDTYNSNEFKRKYMTLKVKDVNLPDEVYDIVIDPGHGGKDSGAISPSGKYYEKNITLDYGKALKKSLEELGLKVKLTRDGKNEKNSGIYDVYSKNGRAIIPNKVKAKYALSIHLNSLPYKIDNGGVEIYAPTKSNLEFAKELADNIVTSAKTTYSKGELFKEMNGVYVRYLTEDDIKLSTAQAHNDGYMPYDIKDDTTYYFMIRETGGIATNAYVDGRNKMYDKNQYYDSNMGVETYLLELGYIVCDKDLNNILNNKSSYIEGITRAVKKYLNL